MNSKFLLASALICTFGISTANAQVKKNAKHQHAHIMHGVKNHELTKAETKSLVKDQREIRQEVKEARADGTITKDERKEIKQDQHEASREIYRKKHNKRDRD